MPVSNSPNSSRQKMINLMYLVFIAMMALNVSSEVLKGFEVVEQSLQKSITNSSHRNELAMKDLEFFYELYPAKAQEEYTKGQNVRKEAEDLFNYIEGLKIRIVQETDGRNGDLTNIKNKENLDAAARVMLAPVIGEGRKLRERIETYRTDMAGLVADPEKTSVIESVLDLELPFSNGRNWETVLFDNMPVTAAITILTKLQSDIRYVEGEVLSSLQSSAIDVEAYRVNDINAMVIPQSQIVMQGTPYKAQIVLAALDTTQKPAIFITGANEPLQDNWYTGSSSVIGEHRFSGMLSLGPNREYPFNSSYFVTEQMAIIAPVLTNMLYETIPNDVTVAIPGVPSGSVTASISAGTIRHKEGNVWTVSPPSASTTNEVKIILTGNVVGGSPITVEQPFRVRRLPPPRPYIAYRDDSGVVQKFEGGTIARRYLLEANALSASIDDGVLDIPYPVTGFQVRFYDSMGKLVPMMSQSGSFTQEQIASIRELPRGRQFYITNITVTNPSGQQESLRGSIDIIVN